MALNNEALQQQLINDLIVESAEGLDRFDAQMLLLEKGEGKPDTLNVIFRVIHTIKGTAGCIGLGKIESVAHVGENLLSLLRDGKIQLLPEMISTLLEYSDALKEMMRSLEQTGQQGDTDFSSLLKKLMAFAAGEAVIGPTETASAAPVPPPVNPPGQGWGLFEEEEIVAPVAKDLPPGPADGEGEVWGLFTDETPATPSAIPVTAPVVTPAPTKASEAVMAAEPGAVPAKTAASVADTAIRVDVSQLDKLMNLVGELVLARNQILQFTAESKEPTLLNASQRLNIITTELQESVMKTRMQPIDNIWAKFPRIVRDVSRELGKQIQLIMEGNHTELDRTIIEAIKDPLTHIIRNSIDHGIEKPE
ncbi:MAG TPA: Hpt domain-containing protein, partial [Verrucomicrobiae bacterium]